MSRDSAMREAPTIWHIGGSDVDLRIPLLKRLRAAVSRANQARDTATSQRLASLETENRLLTQQLRDAEEKLEAITTIERSIREQD